MRSPDDIAALHGERQKLYQPDMSRMARFENYVSGKDPVAVPELDQLEQSAIANLAKQGLEQLALRVASVMPMPKWPALRPGIKQSEDRAKNRLRANLGWWEENDMQGILRIRAENYLGLGLAPVSVLPNPKTGIPEWRVRKPRQTLPAPSADPLCVEPDDCIFSYKQTWGWLVRMYGDRAYALDRPKDCRPDHPFWVLEYVSPEQITFLAMPCAPEYQSGWGSSYDPKAVLLENIPNKADRPLVFAPSLYGLAGTHGRFDGTQGAHQMRAKLLALAYITASKGALPDMWLEPMNESTTPEILAVPDHKTGTPGVVAGGRLRPIDVNPGFMTSPMLSILEREIRMEGGVPAEFSGQNTTTVQTGRRGAQLLGSTVDFPIQDAQNRLARSMAAENKAAVAIVRNWTPGKRTFYIGWKGHAGQVEYDPQVDFETDNNTVDYPLAGSDLNNELLRTQQKVATGLWSRRTAREMDPETQDAELEHDRVVAETIEDAVLQEFLQPGSMSVTDKARVMKLVISDKLELAEAIDRVNEEAKARQAEQVPAGDPAAQMGLAMPGQGEEATPIAEGPESLGNLSAILSQLRPNPQMAA